MGVLDWLKRKMGGNGEMPEPVEDVAARLELEELAGFVNRLSGELNLDANTKVYLKTFVVEAKRDIKGARSLLFGPESTPEDLVAEAAYQGYLDPLAQGAAKGAALRDDVLMRMMIYYAERGHRRSADGVASVAAGSFKKRSSARGNEEAIRMAKDHASADPVRR